MPCLALFCLSLAAIAAPMDDHQPASQDAARGRLEAVAAHYKGLAHYADQGTLRIAANFSGRVTEQVQPLSFALERPLKFAATAGGTAYVCDGSRTLSLIGPTRRTLTGPSPSRLYPAMLDDSPAGALVLGGPGGTAAAAMVQLLLGDDATKALLDAGTVVSADPDASIDDRAMTRLRLHPVHGPDLRLWVDAESKLVRRVEVLAAADRGDAPTESAVGASDVTITWDSGPIRTDGVDSGAFTLKVPEGFSEVSPLKPREADAAAKKKDDAPGPR
jgi:hypothetical protein